MIRMQISRRALLFVAAGLAGAALGVRSGARAGAGLINIRMSGDIQVLDPGYMIGGNETTTQFATLPRLAVPRYDDGWTWAPSDYVSSIKQLDDLNIAFTLKPGFLWTDGWGDLTSDDVKFSIERMPDTDWGGRWSALDRVDVTDRYSGVIVLKEPFVPIWLVGIASESGTILCKEATIAAGGKFTTRIPAQNGPYLMSEWLPKQKLVFVRYADWKGTPPAYDEVRLISIEDDKAAELAYEAGEVDFTSVSAHSIARLMEDPLPDTVVITAPGPYETWLGMNTEHPKLTDIRIRKAIQRAVDVDSILQAAYAGASAPSHGIIPPGVLGHRTSKGYRYDPAEAQALLEEVGAVGLALELTSLNQQDFLAAAQIVQANLAELGIEVIVNPVDSGTFWNLGLESEGDDWKNLQLWLMRYVGSPDPADHMQWFVKSQIGIWNWERWWDPEFEELWSHGLREQDPAKRSTIYVRMQEIMEDTGAYVWITHEPVAFIHRDTLVPEIDPAGQFLINGFRPA